MSKTSFNNPWSDVEGFTDLGSCTVDGVYYELYCFPGRNETEIMHLGARYGKDGDYISATFVASKLGEARKVECYSHIGPIAVAVERMAERNLITETLYDLSGNVIVKV